VRCEFPSSNIQWRWWLFCYFSFSRALSRISDTYLALCIYSPQLRLTLYVQFHSSWQLWPVFPHKRFVFARQIFVEYELPYILCVQLCRKRRVGGVSADDFLFTDDLLQIIFIYLLLTGLLVSFMRRFLVGLVMYRLLGFWLFKLGLNTRLIHIALHEVP
jgi:hypothetical protein